MFSFMLRYCLVFPGPLREARSKLHRLHLQGNQLTGDYARIALVAWKTNKHVPV